MTDSFNSLLDQAYHGQSAEALLDATPAALKYLSEADAEKLEAAFGIRTLRALAENRFFWRALAIQAAAGVPAFDPGPPPPWERFFAGAPLDYYRQHPAGRFRLAFGPVYYRGRLDGSARLLVVGQDPSTNEILAQRVFVGRSGQRVQGFLRKLGLTRSYLMLNTFLFSVFGQFNAELRNISLEPTILDYRNNYLDRVVAANPIQAVISFGNGAHHAVEQWAGSQQLPSVALTHPAAHDEEALLASWNEGLDTLRALLTPDDGAQPDPVPYGTAFAPQDTVAIPRADLPFGLPDWHGVDGGHSHRDGNRQIIWTAPA